MTWSQVRNPQSVSRHGHVELLSMSSTYLRPLVPNSAPAEPQVQLGFCVAPTGSHVELFSTSSTWGSVGAEFGAAGFLPRRTLQRSRLIRRRKRPVAPKEPSQGAGLRRVAVPQDPSVGPQVKESSPRKLVARRSCGSPGAEFDADIPCGFTRYTAWPCGVAELIGALGNGTDTSQPFYGGSMGVSLNRHALARRRSAAQPSFQSPRSRYGRCENMAQLSRLRRRCLCGPQKGSTRIPCQRCAAAGSTSWTCRRLYQRRSRVAYSVDLRRDVKNLGSRSQAQRDRRFSTCRLPRRSTTCWPTRLLRSCRSMSCRRSRTRTPSGGQTGSPKGFPRYDRNQRPRSYVFDLGSCGAHRWHGG